MNSPVMMWPLLVFAGLVITWAGLANGQPKCARDLVIAIDTTGSMGGVIEAVKTKSIELVDAAASPINPDIPVPLNYVLSPFNDPTIGPFTKVPGSQAATFKAAIGALGADGGGDEPELCLEGLLQASGNAGPRAVIHVFTDAPTKHPELLSTVIASLTIKQQLVNFIITSNWGYSGDEVYRSIAAATNGMVIPTSDVNAQISTSIGTLFEDGVWCDTVVLFSLADSGDAERGFKVNVDESMTLIDVVLQGNATATLFAPKSKIPLPVNRVLDTPQAKVYRMMKPEAGEWTIDVRGAKAGWSCMVRGRSPVDFSYTFRQPADVKKELDGNPVSGEKLVLAIHLLCVGCTVKRVYFVKGDVITPSPEPLEYFPSIMAHGVRLTVPRNRFFVMIEGYDAKGNLFQRQHRTPVLPTQIKLELLDAGGYKIKLAPGSSSTIRYNIINTEPDTAFFHNITGNQSYITSSSPADGAIVSIATNGIQSGAVRIKVPLDAIPGTMSDFLITIAAPGSATNFNMIRKTIVVISPPTCTIQSTTFTSACSAVGNDASLCATKRWSTTVKLADLDSGLSIADVSRTYLAGSAPGLATWNLPRIVGGKSKEAATGIATGTCCTNSVTITVRDDDEMEGFCSQSRPGGVSK